MLASLRKLLRPVRLRPGRALLVAVLLALTGLSLYVPCRLWWAKSQLRAAQRALERREYRRARRYLVNYLTVWPNSFEAHLLLARTARRAGYYPEAERRLDICRRLEGETEAVELESSLIAVQQGELSAERQLWERVDQDPETAVLILEALCRGYRKNYLLSRMRKCLEAWLKRQPDNVSALLQRGWISERKLDFAAAIADYRRAVRIDPDDEAAPLRLAQTLLRDGQAREALPLFQRLQRERPADPAVGLGLAQCRRRLGETAAARRLLDQLAQRHPREFPILLERGRLVLELGRWEEAERWLRRAVALAPHDYQANYSLSQCLNAAGPSAEAQEYKARVKRIEADLNRMGSLTDQLQGRPQDPDLRCEIGELFLRNAEPQEGLLWLQSALRADPRHARAHRALADYYTENGQPTLAERHRQLAARGGAPKTGADR